MIDRLPKQPDSAPSSPDTYDLSLLDKSADTWARSPALRTVYQSIFADMTNAAQGSDWLELGAGAGFFKQFTPNVVTSDIRKTRFVDQAISAYTIEQSPKTWDTIFAMDMLHHLTQPFRFFKSASKALKPGGKIVLAEPAATAWGTLFYTLFHQEPIHPSLIKPPFEFSTDSEGGFANMGMGQALFHQRKSETQSKLAAIGLSIKQLKYRDVLTYPATGGLSQRQMLPSRLIQLLLEAEALLPQAILRLLGLRMTIVLEKTSR